MTKHSGVESILFIVLFLGTVWPSCPIEATPPAPPAEFQVLDMKRLAELRARDGLFVIPVEVQVHEDLPAHRDCYSPVSVYHADRECGHFGPE